MRAHTQGKHAFERIEMSKDEALEMFAYNDFKTDVLKRKVPDGAKCTAYRCGDLIDLCRSRALNPTPYTLHLHPKPLNPEPLNP